MTKVSELIRHYAPTCLVLEDCAGKGSRRSPRVADLIDTLQALARQIGLRSRRFSPGQVRKVFSAFGATTKHQIAQVIARQLPEMAPHLPRFRKPWMSEDYRMAMFDAVSLALTCFYSRPATRP